MTITELRAVAEQHGVYDLYALRTEKQLVWAVQKARGEAVCFQTDRRIHCAKATCEWQPICLRLVAEWRR